MIRRSVRAASLGCLALIACVARDAGARIDSTAADRNPGVAVIAPLSTDSDATLAAFRQRVAQIDRDTLRLERIDQPLALGAGTDGLLTGWRAGRIWQKLRIEGEGAAFRTHDAYWFSDGAFLSATLSIARIGKTPRVDSIWFRDRALYRWRDAAGRHLDPHARSTQYEVQMMRARLDSLLRELTNAELSRGRMR